MITHPSSRLIELIIFTKYPEPGTTKTRLIPAIGSENAALLQKQMTEKIVTTVASIDPGIHHRSAIYFCGGDEAKMQEWLGNFEFFKQGEGDLGEKMMAAFRQGFENGADQILIVGSDIPEIDNNLLTKAIRSLAKGRVVLGPSHDGGYYLIGFTKNDAPGLFRVVFRDIEWSSPTVFQTTCQRVFELGLDLVTLRTLRDIDTPEDLDHARQSGLL